MFLCRVTAEIYRQQGVFPIILCSFSHLVLTFLVIQTRQQVAGGVLSQLCDSGHQLVSILRHEINFLLRLNVPDHDVALAPQTAARSWRATTARGQSSTWGGQWPCCRGDLRPRSQGPGTPHRSFFSSGEPRLEQPGSERTPLAARWACPEGATPLARGRSAAGRWGHGNDATTRRRAWNHKKKK